MILLSRIDDAAGILVIKTLEVDILAFTVIDTIVDGIGGVDVLLIRTLTNLLDVGQPVGNQPTDDRLYNGINGVIPYYQSIDAFPVFRHTLEFGFR